jgi:signal transduction histidine kinase
MMNDLVLVVEDQADVLNNIEEILVNQNYRVSMQLSAESAIKAVKTIQPDIVISDIMMPGLNGYDLLEHFKKNPELSAVPFVFLTSKTADDDLRYGMNLGADDYLKKPFRAADLIKAIETRIKQKQKINETIDKIRNSFALAVPHELRTPLIPLLGYSEMLLDDYDNFTREEIKKYVENIRAGAVSLHNKIERFILLASIQSELKDDERMKSLRNDSSFILADLLREIVLKISKKFGRTEDMYMDFPSHGFSMKMNEYYFTIVMSELIENAIKFSDPNTAVTITSENKDDCNEFTVINFGYGLSPEQIANINLFVQHHLSQLPKRGSGIGLYMVKEIIKSFNGSFSIESSSEKYVKIILRIPSEQNPFQKEKNINEHSSYN